MTAQEPDEIITARYLVELRQAWREVEQGFRIGNAPPGLFGFERAVKAAHDRDMARGHIDAARVWLQLLGDLRDIGDNQAPPRLTPTFGRKGTSHSRANLIAVAARALDKLMEAGDTAEAAMRQVYPLVHRLEPTATKQTIKEWRDRFHRSPCRHPDSAIARYRSPLPNGLDTAPPRQQAEFLLRQLREASALRPSGI
jgi:hypothetical protein